MKPSVLATVDTPMAIKKNIQAAIAGGAKIVTALYLTFEIDPYWDNWSYCPNCRVYQHHSEISNCTCAFCGDEAFECLPDQRYYGMTPTQRYRAQEIDGDWADWHASR